MAPGYTFALYNASFFSDNGKYLTTEVNYFNNSQTETIKNGCKLDTTSSEDTVTVKDGRSTDIEGTDYRHVTEKVTEKFDQGRK